MDITIIRGIEKFTIDIHRKKTYTDTIAEDLCYPKEQKMAAIRYFYNRVNKYQLSPKNLEKGNNILQQIPHNNGYDVSAAKNLSYKKNANMEKKDKDNKKIHWVKLTYIGKETTAVTKAFRNTNVNITFSTNNTISNLLTARHHTTKGKYDNNGIYQLTCPTCSKKYIGQTGRSFKIRFQEHFRDFKHGNSKSSFVQHLLDNGHSTGPIEDIIETIHVTNKGQIMGTLEKFTSSMKRNSTIKSMVN